MFYRIAPLVYLIIGVVVASQHGYLSHLDTASRVISAVLGILLWPLILFGVSLNLK